MHYGGGDDVYVLRLLVMQQYLKLQGRAKQLLVSSFEVLLFIKICNSDELLQTAV